MEPISPNFTKFHENGGFRGNWLHFGEMGALSPPWPPALIEPMEYGAFRRVPGPPKAKSREIPHILG